MKKILALAVIAGFVIPGLVLAQNADNGKKLYTAKCVACHGEKGDGNGPAGKALKPKPTDFTDAKLMSGKKDEELVKVTKEGGKAVGKSPLMAAFGGQLKDEEIKDIVAYIKTFVKK